jgi:hypothetical protein
MKNLLGFAVLMSLAFAGDKAKDTASPIEPGYDSAKMVDTACTVTEVREVAKGLALAGVHLTVQAGSENLDIYVGPAEFVKVFDITFAKGEKIHVVGSKVPFEDSTVVLAREIRIGTVTLLIRDKEGSPLWKYFLKPPVG